MSHTDPGRLRPPTLKNLTISLTLACNQGCQHCWVDAGPTETLALKTAEILTILRDAQALGAEHVKFTGGEPLLKPDMVEIIRYARALGYRVSLETNGTLLSVGRLEELRGSLDKLHFYVSIDGARAETHDSFRQQRGAFAKTIQNLDRVREQGGYFSIQTVVRRENFDEIVELHQRVRSLGASQHKLILAINEMGRGSAELNGQLTPVDVFKLLDDLPPQRLWDYGWNPRRSRDTVLMTTLPPAFQTTGNAATCGWSESFLSVLANGDVALCQGLYGFDEAKAGNVRDESLARLWAESELFVTTRAWTGAELHGICGNCAVAMTCRGLCRANAISIYRDVRAPYPFCQQMYDAGLFPADMMSDPNSDSRYVPHHKTPNLPRTSKLLPLYPVNR